MGNPKAAAWRTGEPTGGVQWVHDDTVDAACSSDQGKAGWNGPLPERIRCCCSGCTGFPFPLRGIPCRPAVKRLSPVKCETGFCKMTPTLERLEPLAFGGYAVRPGRIKIKDGLLPVSTGQQAITPMLCRCGPHASRQQQRHQNGAHGPVRAPVVRALEHRGSGWSPSRCTRISDARTGVPGGRTPVGACLLTAGRPPRRWTRPSAHRWQRRCRLH